MIPKLKSLKTTPGLALALALGAAAFLATGCAGGKKSSDSDYSALGSSSSEASSEPSGPSAAVQDAQRSAEEAEKKAHELRMEKAKGQASTPAN